MPPETAIDNYLNEEARYIYVPPLSDEEFNAVAQYYHEHCLECDGALTDEDWQADICPTCGCVLMPF